MIDLEIQAQAWTKDNISWFWKSLRKRAFN